MTNQKNEPTFKRDYGTMIADAVSGSGDIFNAASFEELSMKVRETMLRIQRRGGIPVIERAELCCVTCNGEGRVMRRTSRTGIYGRPVVCGVCHGRRSRTDMRADLLDNLHDMRYAAGWRNALANVERKDAEAAQFSAYYDMAREDKGMSDHDAHLWACELMSGATEEHAHAYVEWRNRGVYSDRYAPDDKTHSSYTPPEVPA